MRPLPVSISRAPAVRFLGGLSLAALAVVAAGPVQAQRPLPLAKPEEVGASSERLRRIDEVIERHIEGHRIAGAVTLVARKGKVVHFKAQGQADVEAKKPMA